jgi:GT2 family glycosyltransferase
MTEQLRVSLLLPNYNNGAVLEHCLRKLSEHTSYPDVELIAADDGSSDDSVAILRSFGESGRFPRFELLEREHAGITTRLNEMLENATGEVIVRIDGDATVETPGWLERMLGFLRSDDRIGVVQAKVIFDSGRVHTYGVNVVCPEGFHDRGTRITEPVGQREALGRLERPMEEESEGGDETAEVDAALACWAMMPTSLVRELGGWDTEYDPVWYEDIDFAFAARTRGRKSFFFPGVRVIHHIGVRRPRVGEARWKSALFEANRRFGHRVPQRLKDAVSSVAPISDRDPAKLALIEHHRAYWRRKWGFDPVNPDLDYILDRYAGTEVCWAYDEEMRRAGEEIAARYAAAAR